MAETVTIGKNDYRIPVGTVGTLLGKSKSTGLFVVDVPRRGRLSFPAHELGLVARGNGYEEQTPMQTMNQGEASEAKRSYRASGEIKVGETKIGLYITHSDLANALGVTQNALSRIAKEIPDVERRGGNLIVYRAADVYRVHDILEGMREFEVNAKQAVKILAKLAAKGITA